MGILLKSKDHFPTFDFCGGYHRQQALLSFSLHNLYCTKKHTTCLRKCAMNKTIEYMNKLVASMQINPMTGYMPKTGKNLVILAYVVSARFKIQ